MSEISYSPVVAIYNGEHNAAGSGAHRRARHYLRIPVRQNQFDMNARLLTKYR